MPLIRNILPVCCSIKINDENKTADLSEDHLNQKEEMLRILFFSCENNRGVITEIAGEVNRITFIAILYR